MDKTAGNKKYINLIKKFVHQLNYAQKNEFFAILKNFYDFNNLVIDDELKKIIQRSLLSRYDLKIIKTDDENEKWIKELYYDDLFKLLQILSSKVLLKKMNGLKILLYGPTGTGKTRVAQSIIKKFQNYELIKINFFTVLSWTKTQTQINLLAFIDKLSKNEQLKIVFWDEIDSIVTETINFNYELHAKIVAVLCQFLDQLPNHVIFMTTINIKNILDEKILNRFNIKFETRKASWKETINILHQENFFISKNREKFITKLIVNNKLKFSFKEIIFLLDKKNIYRYINHNIADWKIFLKVFHGLISEPSN